MAETLAIATSLRCCRKFAWYLAAALLFACPFPAAAVPDTVNAWCELLGKRLHSVSAKACLSQGFIVAPELTSGGNSLVWRDVAPASANEHEPARRILMIGGIHGDELTSVSVIFRWLSWLINSDVNPYVWRVMPVVNPDGLLVRPATRVNHNGIDINRNFPTPDWDRDATAYWIKRTRKDPRRYPGEHAGSEVETRWLQEQIEEFKPDLIISTHAPYNLLDYDGSVPEPLRFGRLTLNRLGVYPGSMGNYAALGKQIPVITIELPSATAMPSLRDQRAIWNDMLKWIKTNISHASASGAASEDTRCLSAQHSC